MNVSELLDRLEPDPLEADAAIYAGAAGERLYVHEDPLQRPDDAVLPRTLQLLDPMAYILTVVDAAWGDGLSQ